MRRNPARQSVKVFDHPDELAEFIREHPVRVVAMTSNPGSRALVVVFEDIGPR